MDEDDWLPTVDLEYLHFGAKGVVVVECGALKQPAVVQAINFVVVTTFKVTIDVRMVHTAIVYITFDALVADDDHMSSVGDYRGAIRIKIVVRLALQNAGTAVKFVQLSELTAIKFI